MPTQVRNRRELFRQYMQNLTAGALPKAAVVRGLYVPRPGRTIADRLVPRLDLAPTGSHLVVGGIGTGKTTEVLQAAKQLSSIPDVVGIYVDVSLHHDLSRLHSGVVVVIAGIAMDRYLSEADNTEASKERKQFRQWAHGYTESYEREDDYEQEEDFEPAHYSVEHPGVLAPPEPDFDSTITHKTEALKRVVDAVRKHASHPVLIFDSFDRMTNLAVFEEIVVQDIRAIRAAGLGTVIVGPLPVLFGTHRPLADRFDHVYQVSAVDVQGNEGLLFLKHVLNVRVPLEVLPDDCSTSIATYSGGVLRDLLAIARAAGEEAYIAGAASIELSHVESAADAFGRDLLLGLSQAEVDILQRVRKHNVFVQTSDEDIALLATRRVLEYGNGEKRYAVHPTIERLLNQLAAK